MPKAGDAFNYLGREWILKEWTLAVHAGIIFRTCTLVLEDPIDDLRIFVRMPDETVRRYGLQEALNHHSYEEIKRFMSAPMAAMSDGMRRVMESVRLGFREFIDSMARVDDFPVVPREETWGKTGMFVVYYDDDNVGAIPQTVEIPGNDIAEAWVMVEYLIGEDLDPVTIAYDHGDLIEVRAYRRATEDGRVYREGWTADEEYAQTIPDGMEDKEDPRKTIRPEAYDTFIGLGYGEGIIPGE